MGGCGRGEGRGCGGHWLGPYHRLLPLVGCPPVCRGGLRGIHLSRACSFWVGAAGLGEGVGEGMGRNGGKKMEGTGLGGGPARGGEDRQRKKKNNNKKIQNMKIHKKEP